MQRKLKTISKLGRISTHPVQRLRKKIDQSYGANRSRNPCVIKRCKAKYGYGVYARRDLKKGVVVAYYGIKLVKEISSKSPTKFVYLTCAPASPKRPHANSRTLAGDIGKDAGDVFGRYVFKGKPVCGHVINEPSEHETENCDMPATVWDEKEIGDRKTFRVGDIVFHEVRTLRTVKKGEELVTMYDDDYERNYKVGKKFKVKKAPTK
jgi:hypothetical protein|mmetsp:Transcript_62791/g.97771  ORF Transcript_62791/g.97771 Transcript_62791/m.97771 type:complete len:208 (-) Transcript_62791:294-917(-)|eukprot:CAMPEP_0169105500 /NCGR_PEP_ID=MMETSP1015-20121227/23829_1 /TAXON_ID=342587 /ORGANISM="Karlodinium micrum, Strain CCMP2283" /LENGTH=207 /DNA_ID=CAMNT_0009166863 /DNA_START=66 /DNA_END=689 /DNA_ORIENTATION=-